MPLYRPHILENNQQLGLWKIDESMEELMENIQKSNIDLGEVRQYKSELKQKQWICARLLLSQMNANTTNIYYDEIGAPLLNNDLFLSVSHSNQLVALLLGENNSLGIDIQHWNKKIYRIKEKFCSSNELNFAANNREDEILHLIWCAKESIYKMCKNPGMIFSRDIYIEPFELSDTGSLKSLVNLKGKEISVNLKFEILEDYTLVYTVNT